MARKGRKRQRKPRKGRSRIIPASDRPEWKTDGLIVALSSDDWARAIADGVEGSSEEGIIRANDAAIAKGVRANDGLPQPALKSGQSLRDVEKGLRPNLRGVTNKSKGLVGTGLRVVRFSGRARGDRPAKRTRMTISTPKNRPALTRFLQDELEKRGVKYLFVTGNVAKGIDANLKAWIDSFLFK